MHDIHLVFIRQQDAHLVKVDLFITDIIVNAIKILCLGFTVNVVT
jgi:hypothetical protein